MGEASLDRGQGNRFPAVIARAAVAGNDEVSVRRLRVLQDRVAQGAGGVQAGLPGGPAADAKIVCLV